MLIEEKFPKTFKSEEQNYTVEEKLSREEFFFKNLNVQKLYTVHSYIPEIVREMERKKKIIQHKEPWQHRGFYPICKWFGRTLYSIILAVKPELIVETGVSLGVSSSYILSALHENRRGRLISVDVEKQAGEIVDDRLRHLWDLRIGESQKVLSTLEIDGIDVFFHDSDHSYSNMMWEFRWAYDRLKEGGVIISDDISWNNSIFDFCQEKGEEVLFLQTSRRRIKAGAIIKGLRQVSWLNDKPTLEEVFGENENIER